ncbi:MAG TPA: hypothetical protein VFM37_06290 [Pseudonocardiaceae bacterium]|nr:hypothetical protein [Pseudonocardiaceae bacterium]
MGRPAGGLEEWLRGRCDAELIELLRRRPDAVSARSFSDLADRLSTPWSVSAALDSADTAMLQLLEVLQALGDGVEAGLVERFLGKPPGAPLERLLRLGLVWRLDDGRLRIAKPVADLTETPLGLGKPVAELLPALSVDQLKAIAASYGDRTQRRKAEWIALLTGVLTDAERILSTLAALPSPVAELATKLAWEGPYLHGTVSALASRGGYREDDPARLVRFGWVLPVGWDAGQMPPTTGWATSRPARSSPCCGHGGSSTGCPRTTATRPARPPRRWAGPNRARRRCAPTCSPSSTSCRPTPGSVTSTRWSPAWCGSAPTSTATPPRPARSSRPPSPRPSCSASSPNAP